MVLLLLTGCKISLKSFGLRSLWHMKLKQGRIQGGGAGGGPPPPPHEMKPSYSYSLIKHVYLTSQLRHSLVVNHLLKESLIRTCENKLQMQRKRSVKEQRPELKNSDGEFLCGLVQLSAKLTVPKSNPRSIKTMKDTEQTNDFLSIAV